MKLELCNFDDYIFRYNLDHPNIIKLYNHYEEEEFIYLILECATGG